MARSNDHQYHIGLKRGDIGRYVILPGDPGRVPVIAEHFDRPRLVAQNREYTTYAGTVDGIPIAVTSTGIGCPSAAIAVEELVAVGADTFIRVGTAGSLQPRVKVGDLIITTGAVRHEGTTRHYIPIEYPAVPDLDVTMALREAARRFGYAAHAGIVHCKDAFYAEDTERMPLTEENKGLWKAWQKGNVLATSMEDAAIFVVSSIRGVRAGEVLAAIGLTYKDQAVVQHRAGVEEAIRTAIEAVKILHALDSAPSAKRPKPRSRR